MADEDYDLEVLLELREQEMEAAEQEYAEELQELKRREEFVKKKRTELKEARERRQAECDKFDERRLNGEVQPMEYRQFEQFVEGMKQDEEQLESAVQRAEDAVEDQAEWVEEARQKMAEATKNLKAVERHKEDWEAEQEVIAKRKQSASMDEVASRIWREKNT